MCGILVPSSGTCIIDGKVPYKERKDYVKNIGVVFGPRSHYGGMFHPMIHFISYEISIKFPKKNLKKQGKS